MNTHAIVAKLPDGRSFELGRMGSIEKAIRLGRILYDELGDEYVSFELVELDPEREFYDSLADLGIRAFHVSRHRAHA